ncbi:MAG: ATP-dependent DNA helicase [Gammaproteobacteria bacterium]|nr:ATP-dependent DNA helicase [Gammaproteobacteria bacterium]
MAESVAETLADGGQLVVEAGTGTGKTFAYLLPALQSGRKTIISTGTKALQDQLYHRDLPLISKVVGRPVTTALLKGRANYLCVHRLDSVAGQVNASALQADLNAVHRWRHSTSTGDRAELTSVAEDSQVWPLVTSTADNCLGSRCPAYQQCHVVKARRAAQEADMVVVNHHLLLADLAMKETGFVEFLPGAEAIIVDEAHQLPDLAIQFFGVQLGSREIERFLDEVRAVSLPLTDKAFQKLVDKCTTAVRQLRADAPRKEGRYELAAVLDDLRPGFDSLRDTLQPLQPIISSLADTSVEADKLHEQLIDIVERLSVLVSDDSWDGLRWLDVNPRSFRLNLTPLDVAETMQSIIGAANQAWVFTSATLAIGDDFSHFTTRMGIGSATTLTFPSPYDLARTGIVWTPGGMPQPSDPEHTPAMMEAVLPLTKISRGGIFCLFTSHRALAAARKWCKSARRRLAGRPLLVQGDAPRDDLLRRFRRHGNAVLLGTGTFWEGVDVRGEALTVVAIDKLPFASPADPLMMARLEYIRRQGGNGFAEHQLPQAALALKQGAGRLLRDEKDYGVVVLCDPRVQGKGYGKTFLNCLAPMPVTEKLEDVKAFFARHEGAHPLGQSG